MKQDGIVIEPMEYKTYDEQVKDMNIKQLLEELDICQIKSFLIRQEIMKRVESEKQDGKD